MNYEEARADLDELALEMVTSTHTWSYSQRLDKLRSLAILTRRALQATSGSPNESAHRSSIDSLLDRIGGMMATAAQLEELQESYKHS
ncbi:hypothetical protein [Stenotrophomonas sp. Iso1]|uniref:hypothetical protein n=1 Tax=Stenotrophomonas sp. Iso1 TaxID=2977283 RepID=UPI0022B7715F|nr:hypothetical protein [Stenotrophomonas sp. Iso1]